MMTGTPDVNAAKIAMLERDISDLKKAQAEFEARDRQRMHAALVTLGSIVVGLVSFIATRIGFDVSAGSR